VLVALISGFLVLVPTLLSLYALIQRSPSSGEADDSVPLAGAGG
jgi:hypothetical protein